MNKNYHYTDTDTKDGMLIFIGVAVLFSVLMGVIFYVITLFL